MTRIYSIDRSAPLKKGESIYIRNRGRYSNDELAKAYSERTTLEFFGMECYVTDIVYLFFDQDHEIEIKAKDPFSR